MANTDHHPSPAETAARTAKAGEERCVDCGDRLDPDHVCWLTTAEWDRLRGVV